MLRHMLRAKIHRATVTEANLEYEGSLSVCPALLRAAGMALNEKILVVNITNGARLETYLMEGMPGEICLNGAAARLGEVGDKVIVMAFGLCEDAEAEAARPTIVHVDDRNAVVNAED